MCQDIDRKISDYLYLYCLSVGRVGLLTMKITRGSRPNNLKF